MSFLRKRKKKDYIKGKKSFWTGKARQGYDFSDIDPGDVLLDAQNISGMNKKNFDDVVETPLDRKSFLLVLFLFSSVFIIFIGRIFYLQIIEGQKYRQIADANTIKTEVIFEKRGVIKDREGVLLAWNEKGDGNDFFKRKYLEKPGFSHLVGYIKYPKKDTKDIYYQVEYAPKTGVEKVFNERLQGELGEKITIVNSGNTELSNIYRKEAVEGENINLSVDAEVQTLFSEKIGEYIDEQEFSGGAILVMDIYTGELIVATSYPEYDQNVLTDGSDYELITSYFQDPRRPSLSRFSFGTYAPGSVMKLFVAMAALKEGVIDPYENIYTNGRLVVADNQNRGITYTFNDWRNHGVVNMYSAIAQSSNIYFYILAGGYKDKKGLGIDKLSQYYKDFGFGTKTGVYELGQLDENKVGEKNGVVPDREWKKEVLGEEWFLGNTYYTAIGQFGVLASPLQIVTATASLVNGGKVLVPKLEKDSEQEISKEIEFSQEQYDIVHEAMRKTVLEGTGRAMNFDFLEIAAKTGTAEIGAKRDRVNSLVTGFFPYENPRYSFLVLGESGPADQGNSVTIIWAEMLRELYDKNPEHIFFKKN